MNELDMRSEEFQLNFERFLVGCEAVEADGIWDAETFGEMQDYYAGQIVSLILRVVTADGWISDREVEYLNRLFGFSYDSGELEQVFESCKEQVASADFEHELVESYRLLQSLNGKLAAAYKQLTAQVSEIFALSDGFVTAEEIAEMRRVQALLN